MKRDQIERFVEYAQHGPLAYGAIPRTVPKCIRFIDKNPNVRFVTVRRVTGIDEKNGSRYGNYVRSYITDMYHHLPTNWRSAAAAAQVGDEVHYLEGTHLAGGLAAQERKGNEWVPVIATPASVHMTWAEYEASQAESKAKERERRIANAPSRVRVHTQDLVTNALLIGLSLPDLWSQVAAEYERRAK